MPSKIKAGGGGFAPVTRKVEVAGDGDKRRKNLEFRKDIANYKLRDSRA
jgi:hypothetical protein